MGVEQGCIISRVFILYTLGVEDVEESSGIGRNYWRLQFERLENGRKNGKDVIYRGLDELIVILLYVIISYYTIVRLIMYEKYCRLLI